MSLIVSHLKKAYGEKTVVEDLSFEMNEPGVYALLGTNGAGKTTSIRMMLGMLAKDGGQVLWNGGPLKPETCNVANLQCRLSGGGTGSVSQVQPHGSAAVFRQTARRAAGRG